MFLLVVFVLIAALTAATFALRRDTRVRIAAYHGALPRFTVPSDYQVSYRVTTHKSSYSEALFVRRPFASVDQNVDHGKPYLVTVSRLGEEVIGSSSSAATLVHTALSPTKRDVRLDALAPDAIAARRLRVVGRSSVLHTTCYVVRSAAPLNAGPLQPLKRSSYVDSCVDRRGLVLYERTVSTGRTTMERTATHVGIGPAAVRGADFSMHGRAIPVSSGGGGVRQLTIDSRPPSGPFWDIPHAPAGFRHTGRYAVVPSQPQAYEDPAANPFGLPDSLVASLDDVYVRAHDAIVIEQGSTVNDAKFAAPTGGTNVDLGPVLGGGQLLLSASGSEVDAEPHEGRRFVRVIGTVPPQELIALARSMTLQPPGTERLR